MPNYLIILSEIEDEIYPFHIVTFKSIKELKKNKKINEFCKGMTGFKKRVIPSHNDFIKFVSSANFKATASQKIALIVNKDINVDFSARTSNIHNFFKG